MFSDHPGFMEYEDGSIEILHADWPAYPAGHGWKVALQSLTMFPPTVRFQQLDEIDRCLLFVATAAAPCLVPQGDLFSEKWFHVAIWEEDLKGLYDNQCLSGISFITEYDAVMAYYNKHKDLLVETDTGLRKLDLPCPKREDYEDDIRRVMSLSPQGIAVTDNGFQLSLAASQPVENLAPAIRERVRPLLMIPLFDTAVREAAVILETRLRAIVGSVAYGQNLIDDYCTLVCSQWGGTQSAFFKLLRGELRTLFKFVRNDFAHSLREINEPQCRSLLARMSQVLQRIDAVDQENAR